MENVNAKNGFVKRASQFGLSLQEANALYREKVANFGEDMMKNLSGAGEWAGDKIQQAGQGLQDFKNNSPEAYQNTMGGLAGAGAGGVAGGLMGGRKGALAGAAGGAGVGALGTSLYNNPQLLQQLLGQAGGSAQQGPAQPQGQPQQQAPRMPMIPQGY